MDEIQKRCILVDPVLDYAADTTQISTASADGLAGRVRELGASVDWIVDTHIHADHLSASGYLRQTLGGRTGMGQGVAAVQASLEHAGRDGPLGMNGAGHLDHLFSDGESFEVGEMRVTAIQTPGHTLESMSYVMSCASTQVIAVGDTLFMPNVGTARCDFPGGDARTLFRSIRRLLSYPDDTRLLLCHDYPGDDRCSRGWVTVGESRQHNPFVRDGTSEADFVRKRQVRDATLEPPALMRMAVLFNLRAQGLSDPGPDGLRRLAPLSDRC